MPVHIDVGLAENLLLIERHAQPTFVGDLASRERNEVEPLG